ncbi:TPA: hypothetical protein N0F65_002761, partial [Lagenidium giganteum]
ATVTEDLKGSYVDSFRVLLTYLRSLAQIPAPTPRWRLTKTADSTARLFAFARWFKDWRAANGCYDLMGPISVIPSTTACSSRFWGGMVIIKTFRWLPRLCLRNLQQMCVGLWTMW